MTLIRKVRAHLKNRELDELKELLREADEFEVREVLHRCSPASRTVTFRLLDKDRALRLFERMDTVMQSELLSGFAAEEAISYLRDMPADDRVRLLDELPAKVARRLLSELPPKIRETTDFLMGYESGTAGRLMNPNFANVRKEGTVREALDRIRRQAAVVENPYVVYVTDDTRHLEGVLSFRDLVLAESNVTVEKIMNDNVISVSTRDDQEYVARVLKAWDLSAIPVLDSESRLVGVVSVHDAMDILEDETTEDIFARAGLFTIQKEESGRSRRLIEGPRPQILLRRIPFLLITLAGGLLAGAVIEGFEDILESIAIVAFFIPVIMDMGGNVGTQSSTIFTRALVLGHVDLAHFFRVWRKEVVNGLSMGLILGAVGGLLAALWQGLPELGLAVAISLAGTITIATALGFLIPWTLVRLGFDQAAGSDPILTTLKDVTGLLIYFFSVSQLLGNML